MFEIIFLGTSASAPSVYRGLASQMVLANEYRFLIDCGEGTQRQILKSGMGFRRLNRILLTHGHLDHILGLGGLISTFVRWEDGIEGIEIYGGETALQRVAELIYGVVFGGQRPAIPIDMYKLRPNDIIIQDKQMTLTAIPVIHRGAGCFGFVFEQASHRPFNADKADVLGVPSGPERGLLVAGKAITLSDGTVIRPDDVLGEEIRGAKLVVIGDVGETASLKPYVQDADCLVIEATYLEEEAEMAAAVGHITARQAAQLAADANVQTLILTHISRRNAEWAVKNEAQEIFPNTYVARDFDHFVIARSKPVERLRRE